MKVGDVIKMIEADGWYLVAMKGSHPQEKHPTKPGRVTITASFCRQDRILTAREGSDSSGWAFLPGFSWG